MSGFHCHEPFNTFAQLNHARLVDETKRRFGYFSPRQAAHNGTALWSTPTGERVIVTAVYAREGAPPGGYRDSKLVSEVVECRDVFPSVKP